MTIWPKVLSRYVWIGTRHGTFHASLVISLVITEITCHASYMHRYRLLHYNACRKCDLRQDAKLHYNSQNSIVRKRQNNNTWATPRHQVKLHLILSVLGFSLSIGFCSRSRSNAELRTLQIIMSLILKKVRFIRN